MQFADSHTLVGDGGANKKSSKSDQPTCSDCHQMHEAETPLLLKKDILSRCLKCHDSHLKNSGSKHQKFSADLLANLPAESSAENGCLTCHRIHKPELLHTRDVNLCVACHQTQSVELTQHRNIPNSKKPVCLNCHDPHTSALSPSIARAKARLDLDPEMGRLDQISQLCLGCHDDIRSLVKERHGIHSRPLLTGQFSKFAIKLFNPGLVEVSNPKLGGSMGCATCHLVHTAQGKKSLQSMDAITPVCTVCHRNDSIERFNLFHKWQKSVEKQKP